MDPLRASRISRVSAIINNKLMLISAETNQTTKAYEIPKLHLSLRDFENIKILVVQIIVLTIFIFL